MPTLAALKNPYVQAIGANVAGAVLNRSAAGSATNALTSGVNDAMSTINTGVGNAENALTTGETAASGTLKDVYGEQKTALQPFIDTGVGALDQIKKFTTPGASLDALYADPGFQFRLKQGQRAIDAAANAGGTRWSGATLKQISAFNQDAASQELDASFNRLMQTEGIGERATNSQVTAAGQYGTNLANLESNYGENIANLETGKAKSLAELQTDLASAQAAGDVAKANSISQAISGTLQSIDQIKQAKSLADLVKLGGKTAGTAGTVAGAVPGVSLGATTLAGAANAGPAVAGLTGALAPVAPAIDIASAAPITAGAAIPAGSTGGFLGTAGAFLTNPITIGIGAAIGIGALWAKSQAHHEANTWVHTFQNDFDSKMAQISNLPNVSPEDKQALQQAQVADYLHAAQDFKGKGSDERKVIGQAADTFRKYYPQFAPMLAQFGL